LKELAPQYGVPDHVKSDNGAEMTAKRVRAWLHALGIKPLFIEPGSPWENGYCESYNGKLSDEWLNAHWFATLADARQLIEAWRQEYNESRPHRSLGERTPNEFACDYAVQSAVGAMSTS
jgi:transposase InsO family protein